MERRISRFRVPKSINDDDDDEKELDRFEEETKKFGLRQPPFIPAPAPEPVPISPQQYLRASIDSYVNSFGESAPESMIIPSTIDDAHIVMHAMETFILRFISEYPSHAQNFDEIKDVVAVITGGKALEHYLDWNYLGMSKDNFTKDFDMRFCHLNDVTSPLFLREAIYLFRTLFYRVCPVFSLTVRNVTSPVTIIKGLIQEQQNEAFLQTILVSFLGSSIPIIDLLPYSSDVVNTSKYTTESLRSPPIDLGDVSPVLVPSDIRFTRGARKNYFGNIMKPVISEGVFYVNFPYLLWDIVGVINVFMDTYPYKDKERKVLKDDYMDDIKSLVKYIKRYNMVVDSLDDSRMLSCNTFPTFPGSCTSFLVDTSIDYFQKKLGVTFDQDAYVKNPDVYSLVYNVYKKSAYKSNRTIVMDGDNINIFRKNPTLLDPFHEMKLYIKDVVEFFAMRAMVEFNLAYSTRREKKEEEKKEEENQRHTCIFVGGSALVVHFAEIEGLLTYDLDIKMVREDGNIASTGLMEQFVSSIFSLVEAFFRNKTISVGSEEYVPKFRQEPVKQLFGGGEMKLARIGYSWGNWGRSDSDYILDLASKHDDNLAPENYLYEDIPLNPPLNPLSIPDKLDSSQLRRTYRSGYYNTRLLRNAVYVGGLYFVGIGYVLWDNVRMLNAWIDRVKMDKVAKYVRKYIAILQALENPELHMNCLTMKRYVDKCSR
jgi:hypothetical protein